MLSPKKENKKDYIKILDWAGNLLFSGHCDDKEVLKVMIKNNAPNDDIFVCWQNENDERNVYEWILF